MAKGASKVKGSTLADVVRIAARPDVYAPLADSLDRCADHVRDCVVFSILTVSERTDRAEQAMLSWRLHGRPEELADIVRVCGPFAPKCRATVGNMARPHNWTANHIARFLAAFRAAPDTFSPRNGESVSAFRDRLLGTIPGLHLTKTSFAAGLIAGGGDVACLDRHMLASMLGHPVEDGDLNTRNKRIATRYRKLERVLVWLAARYGWKSAAHLQWAVWSALQGITVTHAPVYSDVSAYVPDNARIYAEVIRYMRDGAVVESFTTRQTRAVAGE